MTFFGNHRTSYGIIALLFFTQNAAGFAPATPPSAASMTSTVAVDTGAFTPATAASRSKSHLAPGSPQAIGRSIVWPGQIQYNSVNPFTEYHVRNDLSFKIKRWYAFNIVPKFTNLKSGVKDGWYLVRMVVARPNIPILARKQLGLDEHLSLTERYVASQKQLCLFTNGVSTCTVSIEFDDLTVMSMENLLYVQITPVKQNSIKTNPDTGTVNIFDTEVQIDPSVNSLVTNVPFTPLKDDDVKLAKIPQPNETDPIADNLDGFVTAALRNSPHFTEDAPLVDEKSYASLDNLKLLTADAPDFSDAVRYYQAGAPVNPNFDRTPLNNMFTLVDSSVQPMPDTMDYNVIYAICAEIGRLQNEKNIGIMTSWVRNCSIWPYTYLNVFKAVHIRSVQMGLSSGTKQPPWYYQLVSSFSASHVHSADRTLNLSANGSIFGLTAFGSWVAMLPLNIVGGSVSESDTQSVTQSGVGQAYATLNIFPYDMEIPVPRYRTCIAFEVNPASVFWSLKFTTNGIYICENERLNRTFHEFYFYANQDVKSDDEASIQAMNIVFRGQRDVNLFLGAAKNFIQPLKNSPVTVGDAIQSAGRMYSRLPGATPGVIMYPTLPLSRFRQSLGPGQVTQPSFLERLTSLF